MRLGIICVRFRKVAPKKTNETDAIFAQLEGVRKTVQQDVTVLRFSLDAKATVLLGNYSRGGQNRMVVKAADHDFQAKQKVTPYCIFLPDYNRAFLYFTASRVTSDFIVDCLLDCWQQICQDFPTVKTLLLLQDNGPENHSRRTQFMQRIVQLADHCQLNIRLAYYPPYHSKYNPVERFWGILEQHWNGSLLDSLDTVLNFARSMTWNRQHPVVTLVHKVYPKGVRLAQKAMALLEQRFERLPGLEKYFVLIRPLPPALSG
jgi:transposase